MPAPIFEALFHHGVLGAWSDGQLLDRFRTGDERSAEAVFAELVRRHGPMVMRVCRDALGDAHAAEDASQAVFLVLARRAGSVAQARIGGELAVRRGAADRVAGPPRRGPARKHERRRAELMAQDATFLAPPGVLRRALPGDRPAAQALSRLRRALSPAGPFS